MTFVKKIDTRNPNALQESIRKGAEDFMMESLKESGALNTLEDVKVETTNIAGCVGDNLYDHERLEHESKKIRRGRSCSVYFRIP